VKVHIDCMPLTVGGGVQVAIGMLFGLADQSRVAWTAVVPTALRPNLPDSLAGDQRIRFVHRRSTADRVCLPPLLRRIEHDAAPDVVFTVFGPPLLKARSPHVVGFALPHLIYERDSEMPKLSLINRAADVVRRHSFRCADHLVVETATARERVARRLKIDIARISVISNSRNPLLQRLPDPEGKTRRIFSILIPSAYYWHKNLELVPKVAAALRQLQPSFDFVFRFTLSKTSREWQAIMADATRLGVGDRLVTLGVIRISDLAAAYRDACVVYLPTLREISSAVYPESFFFRRPLITTDMDFARELCSDAALLVEPQNPVAAASALLSLAQTPSWQEALSRLVSSDCLLTIPRPGKSSRCRLICCRGSLRLDISAGTLTRYQSSAKRGEDSDSSEESQCRRSLFP